MIKKSTCNKENRDYIIITRALLYLKLVGAYGRFCHNKTLVEFDLVQHEISFPGSSDVSLRPTSLVPAKQI